MHEHLDRVLEQRLGHGGAVDRHRLQPARGGEPAQVIDGERGRGCDVGVRPRRLAPRGQCPRRPRLVESEAGLGDLLLDGEEPAVALAQVDRR